MSSSSPPRRAETLTSSSPGRTSSPAKSLRNRMTSAMRRASTGLAIATKVPTLSRSSSKSSLKPEQPPAAASEEFHSVPSPVAESPAREAAANAEASASSAPLGPSPLANVTAAQDPTPEATPAPAPAPELASVPATVPKPQSAPVPEPEPESRPAPAPEPVSEPVLTQITASPELAPATLPQAPEPFGFSDSVLPIPSQPVETEKPLAPSQDPTTAEASISPPTEFVRPAEPATPKVVEERAADYFSFRDPVAPVAQRQSTEHPPVKQPAIAPPSLEPVPVVEAFSPQQTSHVQIPTDTTFAWIDEPALGHKASRSNFSEPVQHIVEPIQSDMPSGKVSTRASRSSMSSSYGVVLPDQKRGRSSSVRFSMDDPFADQFAITPMVLPMEVPKPGLSPVASVAMPEPVFAPHVEIEADDEGPVQDSPTPISFPLPPMRDVIGTQSSRAAASAYSLGERDGASPADGGHRDIDERVPLLQHAAPLGHGGQVKTAPSRGKTAHIVATFASGPITTELAASHTLHTLGWSEYVLPDSSCYYHHATMRVTTDIDLRNPRYLQHVTEYLEKQLPRDTSMPPPQGWELWIKSGSVKKHEVHKIQQSWVNHKLRIITSDAPPTISGDGLIIEHFSDDDKLDMEYRYWGFIEGHPAHVSMSTEAHTQAMDALKWSYTDCLLPSARPAPPPFAPQECQELMNLLRSFDNTSGNALVVQTRVVSRVLLRVAQWRQIYFRPNKPLPKDAIKGVKERHTPFGRALVDFIVGCLCLGIPYIFLNRSHHQRFDEESGLYSAGPMLMVSACACLVAAVILSASVTFLSLPQLDDVPRLAGFLAIAFSASSMVSAVVALLRYKAEIDRSVIYLGGEGLMVLSRRSIIFSLPLVFLAWAIAAFMTGITLYSFRGASVSSRVQIRHPFDPYTHWAVVGTLGVLGGMLTVAGMFARR